MHQEFDPRDLEPALPQPEARRRKIRLGPLLLVLAGIGIFAAITWYAYEAGQRQAAVASMPVIKADSSPTRVRPDSPGGLTVPNQDALVLNDPGGTPNRASGGIEKLLPPPEAPLPRPAPSPAPVASSVPPPIAVSPTRPAAGEPPAPAPAPRSSVESQPAAPAPAPPIAAAPSSPPAAAPASPSQIAALPSAARPPVSVVKPAAGGAGWRVQLAAVRATRRRPPNGRASRRPIPSWRSSP